MRKTYAIYWAVVLSICIGVASWERSEAQVRPSNRAVPAGSPAAQKRLDDYRDNVLNAKAKVPSANEKALADLIEKVAELEKRIKALEEK